jgi:hypothetical protein
MHLIWEEKEKKKILYNNLVNQKSNW